VKRLILFCISLVLLSGCAGGPFISSPDDIYRQGVRDGLRAKTGSDSVVKRAEIPEPLKGGNLVGK